MENGQQTMKKVAANENEPQQQEEEDGEEEKQKMNMDKFYGLIRSYREACNRLRNELEVETNTKKRKCSDHIHGQRRQSTTTTSGCCTWFPSFQSQDFNFNEGSSESGTPAVALVDLIKRPALTLSLPISVPPPPPAAAAAAGLTFSTHNNNHNDDGDSGGLNLKLTL